MREGVLAQLPETSQFAQQWPRQYL